MAMEKDATARHRLAHIRACSGGDSGLGNEDRAMMRCSDDETSDGEMSETRQRHTPNRERRLCGGQRQGGRGVSTVMLDRAEEMTAEGQESVEDTYKIPYWRHWRCRVGSGGGSISVQAPTYSTRPSPLMTGRLVLPARTRVRDKAAAKFTRPREKNTKQSVHTLITGAGARRNAVRTLLKGRFG
ncbi:hypothetical protein E2C01_037787 [Portunus trituberculatus]|uniref:Uncharacterized protein n=1 Tax=Portunus trituberculatus TaxID=210409 RepID=A0A5B7FG83_PORTR|nr:hypothetical protein [Portunus trituberculatus]